MKLKGEVYLNDRPTLVGGIINLLREGALYRPDTKIREGVKVQIYHQGRVIFSGTMQTDNTARGQYVEYGRPNC